MTKFFLHKSFLPFFFPQPKFLSHSKIIHIRFTDTFISPSSSIKTLKKTKNKMTIWTSNNPPFWGKHNPPQTSLKLGPNAALIHLLLTRNFSNFQKWLLRSKCALQNCEYPLLRDFISNVYLIFFEPTFSAKQKSWPKKFSIFLPHNFFSTKPKKLRIKQRRELPVRNKKVLQKKGLIVLGSAGNYFLSNVICVFMNFFGILLR